MRSSIVSESGTKTRNFAATFWSCLRRARSCAAWCVATLVDHIQRELHVRERRSQSDAERIAHEPLHVTPGVGREQDMRGRTAGIGALHNTFWLCTVHCMSHIAHNQDRHDRRQTGHDKAEPHADARTRSRSCGTLDNVTHGDCKRIHVCVCFVRHQSRPTLDERTHCSYTSSTLLVIPPPSQ